MKRAITYKGKPYTMTFDEDGVVDTISDDANGELIVSTSAVAKYLIRHADSIYACCNVKHVERQRRN